MPASTQDADDRPRWSPRRRPSRTPWRVEGRRASRPPGGRKFWVVLAVLLAANFVISDWMDDEPRPPEVPYSFFVRSVERGDVRRVTGRGETIEGAFKRPIRVPNSRTPSTRFRTIRPDFAVRDDLLDRLMRNGVVVSARSLREPRPLWQAIVFGFGPTILLVGLFFLLIRRAAGFGAIGRSKAKRYAPDAGRTRFSDVAGIDEAQEELVEVVGFLKDPDRYRRLGAAIPRGVLLCGPPGTGKTLLARAVAGEADAPFFSLSASEFVEMVVGVGASRVRDLFAQAKREAPAIIFIDELDAIGRARSSGQSLAGHDEREQTLNQILTEMDGFSGSEGVIVLAATNRPEILDRALLRPGRFDRRIVVNAPDQSGRRRILEVHTRGVPLAEDVDLGLVASTTPGMVGADLKNLVNEAVLTAARHDRDHVGLGDFREAFERVVLGAERRITLSEEERERTAFHEAGHALLGMLEPGADPVRKVSIVPRGHALGITMQTPEADRYGYGAAYLYGRIVGALGGRAAEELVYGDLTTGAESDLEQVTRIARMMVGRWGMSQAVGPVSVLPRDAEDAALPAMSAAVSESTRELVDAEVRRIVDECYARALDVLREHRRRLDALATELLARETLDEIDAYAVAGFDPPSGRRPAGAERPPLAARDGAPRNDPGGA